MFYLGTWESGDLDSQSIKSLIDYSFRIGINSYDTAMVYGKGQVESALGDLSNQNLTIISKIPAQIKPLLSDKINVLDLYPYDYIDKQIYASLQRLGRKKIHAMLLHNWCYSWESLYEEETRKVLTHIKKLGIAKYVGISLPDGYEGTLHKSKLLEYIDIIECPYNDKNIYVNNHLHSLKDQTQEIVLRSFLKGNNLPSNSLPHALEEKIKYCIENGVSFTIGSKDKLHIKENLNLVNNLTI